MKKFSIPVLVIVVTSLLMVSCKQTNKTGAMIPADAAMVFHLNAKSLSSKLSWDEVKQTNWFQEMYKDAPDSLAKKLMNDPATSGMDVAGDFVFFLKKQGNHGYMVFQGFVKDNAAFEAFNKKVSEGAAVKKVGSFNNILLPGGAVATWKDDRFVYVVDAPYMSMNSRFSMEGAENSEPAKLSADTLMKIGQSLFDLGSNSSLAGNEKFGNLVKEDGDLHMWMNSEYLSGEFGDGMFSMLKANTLFQGNVSATTISFDNGKIIMKSKGYYNKELSRIFDKYPAKDINAELINRIPSQDVVAAFAMNYHPEALKDLMKVIGVDGIVNGFLGKSNYSIEEFIKANKGDILIAVTDFAIAQRTDTVSVNGEAVPYPRSGPDAKVLFATSINDRPAFDKLIGTVKAQGLDDMAQGFPDINYSLNNNWFAISNSSDYVSKFLAGPSTSQAFASKLSGHPFGGFIDLQKIMKTTQTSVPEGNASGLNASLAMWQDIVITGGEYKDGALSAHAEVNLVNKNVNSLKQLNSYFDQVSKSMRSSKTYEGPMIDSIPAAPAPSTN